MLASDDLNPLLDRTFDAMRQAAQVLLQNYGKFNLQQADQKSSSDFVTRVDRESEEILRDCLLQALPGSIFLGEETGQSQPSGEYRWIVDPLDGTTNYLQQFPVFSISVALEQRLPEQKWGELILGAVLHPLTRDLWSAARGQGAWKNGRKIQIGQKPDLARALLATGFPFRAKEQLQTYLKTFEVMFLQSAGIRRAGSAALDLCWVAEGVFDGFWEHNLAPWDIAAGALIIEEAGGVFTSFSGNKAYFDHGNVVGANSALHALLVDIIHQTIGRSLP